MRRTLAKRWPRSDRAEAASKGGAPREKAAVVVMTDAYPVVSETFVGAEIAALRELGHEVRVEALEPGDRSSRRGRTPGPTYWSEDSLATRLRDLARLVVKHPWRSAADVFAHRRWRRQEFVLPLRSIASAARRVAVHGDEHVHVHFASGAALCALRLSRLTGVPYSLTAHAYDIYQRPRNLPEKLRRSAFATSGCDYTVADLRRMVPPADAARIHKVVMGVDGRHFLRRVPYPGGRSVAAVGRLLEKKGFRHLLEAAALLADELPLERLEVVGNGPLREELRARARDLGLDGTIAWLGAASHDHVRDVLERADLLVMPCVVAADGDRDSMPVVVKEAMAMEVPVVASDEVGLPELVMPPWGVLVPPGDADALARAIRDVLSRSRDERVAMGRAGRPWVLEHCDVTRETERLSGLIERSRA